MTAGHEHSFPVQPPRGSFLAPGPCACGVTYERDQAEARLAEALAGLRRVSGSVAVHETDEDPLALDYLTKVEAEADPAPWTFTESHGRDFADEGWSHVAIGAGDVTVAEMDGERCYSDRWQENAVVIVAARNALPELLSRIEAVRDLADRWDDGHLVAAEHIADLRQALTGRRCGHDGASCGCAEEVLA